MMKTLVLAVVLFFTAARAQAITTPVTGSDFAEIDWGPLNPDGNYINSSFGFVGSGAPGDTYYVPGATSPVGLSGQGALLGQDGLTVTFGFSVNQILFNVVAGDEPADLFLFGTNRVLENTYSVTPGASSYDVYSSTGITGFQFEPNNNMFVTDYYAGTLYISNSSDPLNGGLFSTPLPEPASLGLLATGLLGVGILHSRGRKPAARNSYGVSDAAIELPARQ